MKIVIIIISVVIIVFLITTAYFGGFNKVNITISEEGGETLVYEEVTGEYKQSAIVMDRIYYSLLNDSNIETYKGFGIYYDNPQKVESHLLRSEAGCIIENKDLDRINNIKGDYKISIFPEQKYITAEFPYKGQFSVLFSLMKVYPALNKFVQKNNYKEDSPVMEIYDMPNKRILYRKLLIEN